MSSLDALMPHPQASNPTGLTVRFDTVEEARTWFLGVLDIPWGRELALLERALRETGHDAQTRVVADAIPCISRADSGSWLGVMRDALADTWRWCTAPTRDGRTAVAVPEDVREVMRLSFIS